jgi:hypothetical protein
MRGFRELVEGERLPTQAYRGALIRNGRIGSGLNPHRLASRQVTADTIDHAATTRTGCRHGFNFNKAQVGGCRPGDAIHLSIFA